jgi:hypothetical protein
LERKASDVYFFGHRSFAEFLVADQMKSNPPGSSEHSSYSKALTDGVQIFLKEALSQDDMLTWAETFWTARGEVRPHYIQFLVDGVGGLAEFKKHLPPGDLWAKFLQPFEDEIVIDSKNLGRLFSGLWRTDAATFSYHYLRVVTQPEEVLERACVGLGSEFDDLGAEIMHALMNSLFLCATRKDRYFSIRSEDVGLRRLAQAGILITETTAGLEFRLDAQKLAAACYRQLADVSLPWLGPTDLVDVTSVELASAVSDRLDANLVGSFSTFNKFAKSFSAITEINKLKRPTRKPVKGSR